MGHGQGTQGWVIITIDQAAGAAGRQYWIVHGSCMRYGATCATLISWAVSSRLRSAGRFVLGAKLWLFDRKFRRLSLCESMIELIGEGRDAKQSQHWYRGWTRVTRLRAPRSGLAACATLPRSAIVELRFEVASCKGRRNRASWQLLKIPSLYMNSAQCHGSKIVKRRGNCKEVRVSLRISRNK
jgi:hypothetical protein